MSNGIATFVRDFTVDFFGSFLPGIFLLLVVYAGVVYPAEIYLACSGLTCKAPSVFCRSFTSLDNLGRTPWGGLGVSIIAYLIGLSYSKRSVDWADSASFYYNTKVMASSDKDPFDDEQAWKAEQKRESERQSPPAPWDQFRDHFILKFNRKSRIVQPQVSLSCYKAFLYQTGLYVVFKFVYTLFFSFGVPVKGLPRVTLPYNNLSSYLKSIGLGATAEQVPWGQEHNEEEQKMLGMHTNYYNALKMRIHMARPTAYHAIEYLEAQNRLIASMFHVATQAWVLVWAFVAIVLARAAMTIVEIPALDSTAAPGNNASAVLLSIAVGLLLCLFRHRILVVFHKERTREVVRVFDLANFLGSFNHGVWTSRQMTADEKADDVAT